MASITQTISQYNGGISQQPDEKKLPGQVIEAKNVLPDITKGLLKRPGGKLIGSLSDGEDNSQTNGRWFHYYRDENEQYVGQISRSGDVNIWRCSDGAEMHVENDTTTSDELTSYLTHTDDEHLQTLTLNDYTYVTNRNKSTAMGATEETVRPPEAYIELNKIAYASQYAVNLFDSDDETTVTTATRISIKSKELGNDSLCPNVGTKIFNETAGDKTVLEVLNISAGTAHADHFIDNDTARDYTLTDSKGESVTVNLEGDVKDVVSGWKAHDNYDNLEFTVVYKSEVQINLVFKEGESSDDPRIRDGQRVQLYNGSKVVDKNSGGGSNTYIAIQKIGFESTDATKKNLYFRLTTTGQAVPSDHTANNVKYSCRYTTTIDLLNGGEGWAVGDEITVGMESGLYTIRVDEISTSKVQASLGLIRPNPTSFDAQTAITAESIIGSIRQSILDTNNFTESDLTQVGNGLYVNINKDARTLTSITNDSGLLITTTNAHGFGTGRKVKYNFTGTILPSDPDLVDGNYYWVIRNDANSFWLTTSFDDAMAETNKIAYSAVVPADSTHTFTPEQKFNISASTDLLNVFTDEIQDIADLPTQCKHGYVVKIANSEAEEDDYYLKFFGKLKQDGTNYLDGRGVWEECPKPGVKTTFDPATMPIQIVRNNETTPDQSGATHAKGWFKVEQISWENRLVGDTVTVPEPSFIGKSINKMIFFRNRLVMLSDENVIMSQPGEFFNFWPKSAITHTATDNIDLSCSSEYPATLYDGIQVNSGLILFTKTQQFMLTTDSDVLSPLTAKINALSTYNFNITTNPISLGTTIAFLDNAGKYSRFWEMSQVLREGEPSVVDQTKIVSELFDKDVNKISNSRENGIIFFSKKDSNTLYGFRYFNTSNQRLQQTWFTWEINGTIQHHAILDDSLYIVVRNNGKDTLQKYSIKTYTDSFTITDDKNNSDATDDVTYRIHLDCASSVAIAADAYVEAENKTIFSKPVGYENTTAQACLYDNNTASDNVGKYVEADIVENSVIVSGDWSNRTVVLGYLFDMQIKLPTIYITKIENESIKADTNASLIIHRIKLNFGSFGTYSTTIDKLGKTSYTETLESPVFSQYLLSNVAIDEEVTKTIPIYERNKNLSITLKSSHPSPATLYSMAWEGDYTSKFYSRV